MPKSVEEEEEHEAQTEEEEDEDSFGSSDTEWDSEDLMPLISLKKCYEIICEGECPQMTRKSDIN